jgi:hypothetical protein
MPPKILRAALGVLLCLCGFRAYAAEFLGATLLAANIPTQKFAEPELREAITSYAISQGDPFLLAYYVDDGSGALRPPLHVVRYDRKTEDMRRADLQDAKAPVPASIPMGCFGAALRISEYRQTIYLEMDVGPSAGCVIVLSSALAVRTTLSGWLLGTLEPDYAILRHSEIHFKSVTALHVEVYDTKRNRTVEVYPPKVDRLRQQYSRLIAPHISDKWCMVNNAECDPQDFDTDVMGGVAVNEAAKVFGFEAKFDAEGFGDAAKQRISPRRVVYVFRQRGGIWQSRELEPAQLQRRFGVSSVQELVARSPDAAFEPVARK